MSTEQQKVSDAVPGQSVVSPQNVPSLTVPETEAPVLSPNQGTALEEHHWEFANFEEGYVRSYISLADTKAAWCFTIASGVLVYLFSQKDTKLALLTPEWSLSAGLLFAGVVLLALSAFYSFRVVAPRLKSSSGEGIVFFGAVAAQKSSDAYLSAVAGKDKRAITEARLKHCYDVARVCRGKYAALKKAIWLGLPGVACAIAHLLFH